MYVNDFQIKVDNIAMVDDRAWVDYQIFEIRRANNRLNEFTQ